MIIFFCFTTKTTLFPTPSYMKDVYDRTWVSYGASFRTGWTQIYTALEVNNSNNYAPPKDALRNAATPTNASAPLTIEWPSGSPSQEVPGTNITCTHTLLRSKTCRQMIPENSTSYLTEKFFLTLSFLRNLT